MPTPSSSEGGGTFNGGTITTPLGVAPASDTADSLRITTPVGATNDAVQISGAAGGDALHIGAPGVAGLTYAPNPLGTTASFAFTKAGNLVCIDENGHTYLQYVASDPALYLEPASGTLLVYQGNLVFRKNSAPADADVLDGGACLWLDATPAATKLMVKAKDSSGAVRTAAIALA